MVGARNLQGGLSWRRLLADSPTLQRLELVRTCSAAGGGGATTAAAAPAAASSGRPQAGQLLELTCTDLAFGGEGICRYGADGFVVFVDRALPGERLTARVLQSKKSFARAVKQASLAPHEHAVEAPCQHFGPCGGCSLQSLQYEAQLAAKQRQVADLLRRTAGLPDAQAAAVLRPIVGCPEGRQYAYRNKMEFSFSREEWTPGGSADQRSSSSSSSSNAGSGAARNGSGRRGRAPPAAAAGADRNSSGSAAGGSSGGFVLGLHKPGSDSAVLPVTACHLQPDPANQLLRRVEQLCRELRLEAYEPASGSGLLQHVVIRRAAGSARSSSGSSSSSSDRASTEEYLVSLVTAADGRRALAPLAAALMSLDLAAALQPVAAGPVGSSTPTPPLPRLVGVVNSVSQRGRPAGERRLAAEHVLAGRGHLVERLAGLELEVSANSFFQTNTPQAEVLYRLVAEAAELRPADVMLDLYCGTGSIGLSLAAACAQVYGVEINLAAVRDAERNAQRNGICNASFLQGDLHKLQLEGCMPQPDVVVVDPARPGLSPAVIRYLRSCGCRRLVYVSCNASTQARDIKLLCAAGEGEEVAASGGKAGNSGGSSSGRSSSGQAGGPFRLVSMQAVDLYPMTWHVETVAVLDAVV
ncbi:tRNA (uracil-5-)-methyltransferase-like protein A [Chlorella sorokiniana]|uniref:tRNA (Uracil-5-)-methyltransferase-like protein A n=1 Tax=Chlorella sorokiniana TaxID=3076 RepID=A0A2P6TLG7_CHLSO|nr:tRNA (uracil-5-)-methyltransferase-like protein A [Chlorella sorokiniana]|eukprot:PRW45128.1 tRNA (uracil-5-)-methyltransferase-like protein A [Chlorella sorokiniana]